MTITTGSAYSQFKVSESQSKKNLVNLQRFGTKSRKLSKKDDNKCDDISDKFLDCLEKTSYFYKSDMECINLAVQFKKCINNKD